MCLSSLGTPNRLTVLNMGLPCSIDEDKVLESALAEHWELDNRLASPLRGRYGSPRGVHLGQ